MDNELISLRNENVKLKEFNELLMMWLQDYQDGRKLVDYFYKRGISSIAIYGFAGLGMAFANDLEDTDVLVKYAIDRNAENVYTELPVLKPDDDLPKVDAIVVAAIHYYGEIKAYMETKVDCAIISLEDVISGV